MRRKISKISKIRIPFIGMILSYLMAFTSLSVLALMPLLEEKYQIVLSYIVACVFWSALAAGLYFSLKTCLAVKRSRLKEAEKMLYKKQHFPGILTFSPNIKHLVLYMVFGVGIILMVSDMVIRWASVYIMFPIVSLTLFSFAMHCIVDGVNYKIYKLMKEGICNDDKH